MDQRICGNIFGRYQLKQVFRLRESLGCVKVNGSELIVGGTYIARNEKATEGLAKGKSDFYLSKVALPAKRWKIKQRK